MASRKAARRAVMVQPVPIRQAARAASLPPVPKAMPEAVPAPAPATSPDIAIARLVAEAWAASGSAVPDRDAQAVIGAGRLYGPEDLATPKDLARGIRDLPRLLAPLRDGEPLRRIAAILCRHARAEGHSRATGPQDGWSGQISREAEALDAGASRLSGSTGSDQAGGTVPERCIAALDWLASSLPLIR